MKEQNQLSMGTLPLGFVYQGEIVYPNGDVIAIEPTCNLMPQVSIDHIVGMIRGATSPIANWYLFLFENNFVPDSDTDSSLLQTSIGETTAYDEAARPDWTHAYDGVSLVSNVASRGVFTFNADKTIYGAGIVSQSAKGGNTGTLLSIARFASPQQPTTGAEFRLAAGLSIIPLNLT